MQLPKSTSIIWVLVAHRSDAKIIKTTERHREYRMVRQFDYPEGRKQNREIDTDAKGSNYSSTAGRGNSTAHGAGAPSQQMKHGLDPQVEATEHLANVFAKELAEALREGRARNEYDELILVAEPGFLGKLRLHIDKETAKRVASTLNRNLSALPMHDLEPHLDELVRDSRKVA